MNFKNIKTLFQEHECFIDQNKTVANITRAPQDKHCRCFVGKSPNFIAVEKLLQTVGLKRMMQFESMLKYGLVLMRFTTAAVDICRT